MKKLFYLGFCLVLMAGFGCAITGYGTITDSNQTSNNSGGDGDPTNTSGKAHIQETSQIATIWPDGTDELFTQVDQNSSGGRVLTTYNNHSTGSEPIFHDDLYCNPDWNGCAIWSAQDGDGGSPFDGAFNTSCAGARSLAVLLSTGRYYGECGRAKLSLQDKASLFGLGKYSTQFGHEGLMYNFNRSNTNIGLRNENGEVFSVPLFGDMTLWVSGDNHRIGTIEMTNSMLGSSMDWYANWLDSKSTDATEVTIFYSGISLTFQVAGGASGIDGSVWRNNRTFHF